MWKCILVWFKLKFCEKCDLKFILMLWAKRTESQASWYCKSQLNASWFGTLFCRFLPRQTQLLSCKPVPNVVLGTNTHFGQTFLQLKGHYRDVEPFPYITHERMWSLPTAKHTLSCSNSNFCSKTIISDFPCCAERKLKNRLHLTRTSENWSCPNTKQIIGYRIWNVARRHTLWPCAVWLCHHETHTKCSVSLPHYLLAMPNSECHISIS